MSARVLVVDDLLPNVKLLEARLTAEYFNVVTAFSGPEAISAATAHPPDIILLDVMMPGMDGFETCRRLKADPRTRHVPIVMVTALSDVEDRVRGLQAGADDFLTKPVNDVALYARIRSLVRLKMLADEWRLRQSTVAQLGAGEAPNPADESAEEARILIVDESATTVERVTKALAVDRHHVEVVRDAETGQARGARGDFDLIIISLLMKSGDGLRLCAALRSQEATRNVPILALVEDGDHDRLARALDLGVNDYLVRPLDRNELVARVRTQIRRRRFQDKLRAEYQRSMSLALTDPLTGLYNRRYAEGHLATLFEQARAADKPLGVLMIDIDRFKAVNDTHGHAVGDQVLRAVSNRLSRNLRAFDTVARWGGEEFVVIMPEADMKVALAVAERLRRKAASGPVVIQDGGLELTVTVSIGVAVTTPDIASLDELMRVADAAMYLAKRTGRNRIAGAEDLSARSIAANS